MQPKPSVFELGNKETRVIDTLKLKQDPSMRKQHIQSFILLYKLFLPHTGMSNRHGFAVTASVCGSENRGFNPAFHQYFFELFLLNGK